MMLKVSLKHVFVCCALIFLLPINITNAYETLTYNEPNGVLPLWNSVNYADGTFLLNFAKPTSDTCIEPELIFRIVHLNGTIVPLSFKIPEIEDFNFCIGNYNEPYMQPVGLTTNNLLITYNKRAQVDNVTYYQSVGKLVNWNGEIIGEVNLTEFRNIPIQAIIINNINLKDGFFSVSTKSVSQTGEVEWATFTAPNENGEIKMISSGPLPDKITASFPFATLDGGYGIAYVLNKTHPAQTFAEDVEPNWSAYVRFLQPNSKKLTNPILLYQTSLRLQYMDVTTCHVLLDSSGHACYVILEQPKVNPANATEISVKIYVKVTFLLSGSIVDMLVMNLQDLRLGVNVSPNDITPLSYGGYLLTVAVRNGNEDTRDIYAYVNNGKNNTMIPTDIPTSIHLRDIYGVNPNNTFWAISVSSTDWTIVSTSLPRFMEDDAGYNNPEIESTYPTLTDKLVRLRTSDISIIYRQQIKFATANISIYQQDGGINILKQSVPGQPTNTVLNDTAIIKVFDSTFNRPGGNYTIVVDNNFVADLHTNEPLLGIKDGVWSFQADQRNASIYSESVTGLVRLTSDGTKQFNSISNKKEFFDKLQDGFNLFLPLERDRLTNNQVTQQDPTLKDRIILAFYIKAIPSTDPSLPNTKEIVDDLHALIRNKWFTPIARYYPTSLLDETYGFQAAASLGDMLANYKLGLIGLLVAALVLFLLYLTANRLDKTKKGKNIQICVLVLMGADLLFDILFIHFDGHDVSSLYAWSLTIIILATTFNFIVAALLIIREKKDPKFNAWSEENAQITRFVMIFACSNVEALLFLCSKFAGSTKFSAPFTEDTKRWIFWAGVVNLIIKDIPQFFIQLIYKTTILSWYIIPFITLIMSFIVLFMNLIGKIFQGYSHLKHKDKMLGC